MSAPRQDHAAAVLSDGRVLIAGGSSDGTNALNTTDIYDPQAGSVTGGPAMSAPRTKATATTLLDGTVVVIGGSDGTNDLASAEFFDPAANNFNAGGSLATARSKHSAFLLPNNNEVLVVGGQSAGNDLASAELYIPCQQSFQCTGAMTTPRADASCPALTKVDGRVLIAGGSSASADLYGFATVKTDAADYPPGSIVTITGTGWQPGETVTLTLVESPLIDTHPTMTAVADAFGNISNNQFSPDQYDISIRFYLPASGSQSQAQTTFMDSVNSVTLTSPTTASPITLSSFPLTVNIAFNYSTSSGATTGVASVATSPVTNSPTTTLTPGLNQSATIPVTLPATTANGPYNASVTVTNMTGGGANQKSDSANSGVHVDVPITQLIFTTSAFSIPINACSGKITVESRDSTGAARNPFSNLTVLLSTTSGGGTFYSNSSCNSATTSVVIASNKTSMDFWYTDSNNRQPLITASTSYEAGPNLSATQLETIGTPCTAAAVTTQPTNQSITYGQNAAFTAAASGNPTPTVQWQVDTGSGFTNISGATSTTFTLTTPPVSTSGNKYRAVITNTCGGTQIATSTDATLPVSNPDTKPPVVTITFGAVDGQNGWYVHSPVLGTVSANDTTTGNSNVTAITCTDGVNALTVGSPTGIGTPTASGSLSVSGEGTHNISCQATDSAGNTGASAGSTAMPVVVKIDTVAPVLSATRLTAANVNGWNNTNVNVEFTCTDSTSGAASISAAGAATGSSTTSPLDVTVTSEGSSQSVAGARLRPTPITGTTPMSQSASPAPTPAAPELTPTRSRAQRSALRARISR